jgi:anhydro-N-acetylmuramic acid kinase
VSKQKCFIGLISGTSMDGIDAVLVVCEDNKIQLEYSHSHAYPDDF